MDDENVIGIEDSILNSVKKQLGIFPENKEFDADIIMHINAAISTLRQLGVGPQESLYVVSDEIQTYSDFLGDNCSEIPQVKTYLGYKCRFGFDPPQNSVAMEALKTLIAEAEWRLNIQVDPSDTFE